MRRLLSSSKYFLALHGTVAGILGYVLSWLITDEPSESYAMFLAGLWALGAFGNIAEDTVTKWRNPNNKTEDGANKQ